MSSVKLKLNGFIQIIDLKDAFVILKNRNLTLKTKWPLDSFVI